MITSEEFVQAQTVVRCIIETIFNYEQSFKEDVLSNRHWKVEGSYHIERCHMAASRFRITMVNDELREKDLYIPAEDVHSWYEELGKEILK